MEFLRKIFLQDVLLTPSQCEMFEGLLHPIHISKNDFLIREGSVCSIVGFVQTGVLRAFIKKEDKEFNNGFFFKDSIISAYTSFLTQTPASGSIQALEDSTLLCISYRQLQELHKQSADWYKLSNYIAEVFFIRKCKRECSLLKDSAQQRYEDLLVTHPLIEQRVAQYHIASYLGIKPESLSRIKSLTYINK